MERERGVRTRRAIIDAFALELKTKGYERASLTAVAERAGISKGALYHHFRNKEHLFEAFYQSHTHRTRSGLLEPPEQPVSVRAAILQDLTAMFDQYGESGIEFFLGLRYDAPQSAFLRGVLHRDWLLKCEAGRLAIERGIEAGEFHASVDAEGAAWDFYSGCFGVYVIHFSTAQERSLRDQLLGFIHRFFDGLERGAR